MWVFLRIVLGSIFFLSGLEKILSPYQNFLYAIQAYQLLPSWAEELTARVFPWIELFGGLFTVLGLWTGRALQSVLIMTAAFIAVVGQALLRGIALDQCGCFGELVHVPPRAIIVFDSVLLLLTVFLLRYPSKILRFSLDRYFLK